MRWRWILLAAVLLAVCFTGYRFFKMYQVKQAAKEAGSTIETVQITKQNLVNSISVTGTIASADARDVSASARDVEVLQVNYEVGDYVNAGDVIVVLDSSELELSLTEAQNKQALSEYKENKTIETASENYAQAVEDGTDDYNKAVDSEADAKEALQEAEADLSEAAEALKRQEERLAQAKEELAAAEEVEKPDAAAYEGGESSEAYKTALEKYEQYAALQKTVSDAQAEYTSRHQAYTTAEQAEEKALDAYETASGNLADAQKQNDRNVSSAGDSLEQAQMEHTYSNDSSQQTIENYEEQIESCTVTAPISGVITAMNVSAGDTYQGEGSVLFSVADKEHFVVSANVDEYDINSIEKDMTAAVIVEALGDEELPATVSFVSPTATESNMGSSTYAIEIALDDVNTELRIGMTAKASIVLEAVNDVLTVPYDCVNTDEEGNSTITVEKDGTRQEIPVTVGMEGDYYVEVSGEGLEEGMQVYYESPMVNDQTMDDGSNGEAAVMMPGGAPVQGNMGGHGGAPGRGF